MSSTLLGDLAQIGSLLAAIATIIAVVVGFRQLRQQLSISGQDRDLALKQLEVQLKLGTEEREQTRHLFEIDIITKLEDRFESPKMVARRKHAADFLKSPPEVNDPKWDELSDFIDFFQVLGTITRLGHIREELAYKWFFYWFVHYYAACREYIEIQRRDSEITWSDLVWLYGRLSEYDLRENAGSLVAAGKHKLREFFEWELIVLSAHERFATPPLRGDA